MDATVIATSSCASFLISARRFAAIRPGSSNSFQPEHRLIGFLLDVAHLRNEIRRRLRATGRAVVCGDGRARANDLRRESAPASRRRQRIDELKNAEGKPFRPIFQIRISFAHLRFRIPHSALPHLAPATVKFWIGSSLASTLAPGRTLCSPRTTTSSLGCNPSRMMRKPSLSGPGFTLR